MALGLSKLGRTASGKKPRIQQRLERAEATCRELRYALCNPWAADWNKVAELNLRWMAVAPKSKYVRPGVLRKAIEPEPDPR